MTQAFPLAVDIVYLRRKLTILMPFVTQAFPLAIDLSFLIRQLTILVPVANQSVRFPIYERSLNF